MKKISKDKYLNLGVEDFFAALGAEEDGNNKEAKRLAKKSADNKKIAAKKNAEVKKVESVKTKAVAVKPAAKAKKVVAKTAKTTVKAEPVTEIKPAVIATAKPRLTMTTSIMDKPKLPEAKYTIVTINNDDYLLIRLDDYHRLASLPIPLGNYNDIGDDYGCASAVALYHYANTPGMPIDDILLHTIGGCWHKVASYQSIDAAWAILFTASENCAECGSLAA